MIKQRIKIKDLLKKYNIRPKKKLGQNFIFDENILNKIVKSIGPIHNLSIIEIGPGPGGLTESLLNYKPESITLIEKDKSFKKILLELTKNYSDVNSDLIFDDFLKININNLEILKKNKVKFVSNLPYYISTQVLLKIIQIYITFVKQIEINLGLS